MSDANTPAKASGIAITCTARREGIDDQDEDGRPGQDRLRRIAVVSMIWFIARPSRPLRPETEQRVDGLLRHIGEQAEAGRGRRYTSSGTHETHSIAATSANASAFHFSGRCPCSRAGASQEVATARGRDAIAHAAGDGGTLETAAWRAALRGCSSRAAPSPRPRTRPVPAAPAMRSRRTHTPQVRQLLHHTAADLGDPRVW